MKLLGLASAFLMGLNGLIIAQESQESRPIELRGTVSIADGRRPPPKCVVTLREARGRRRDAESAPAEMVAPLDGADGFAFSLPKPGTYVLTVTARGCARERRLVTVNGPETLAITLLPALALYGRVVDRATGEPIAGAGLRASVASGMGDAARATSAANGTFELDGLAPDVEDLRIVATAPGHAPRDLAVEHPIPAEGMTIDLEPAWVAQVRVVDDRGQPVGAVDVRARLPFAVAYSNLERHDFEARTDASGIAAFDELIPGEPIVFEVTRDPFVPTRSPVVVPRASGNGTAAPATEIVLTAGRVAQLTVMDAFDAPIEDAEVRILPLVEPRLAVGGHTDADPDKGSVRTGHTDARGKVAFEKLPAEILTAEVRAPLYETRMIVVDLRGFPLAEAVVRLERDLNPPAASLPWLSSGAEVFATAEATGLPVMISMAMDGERANDWIASHHFKDPEVVRVAELLPCLLASVFGEGGFHAEGVDHGETDGICTRYGSIPCAAHQAVEPFARAQYLPGVTSFQVPRNIFVTANGRELSHRTYYLSERDLRWMILRALRDADSDAAVWISMRRLQPLWRALCAETDSEERKAAIATLAHLVSSGDEYALALLQEFALCEVPAAVRLQILDALLLPALADPVRALRGFLRDAEPSVRHRAWQLLRGASGRLDLGALVPHLARHETDDSVMAVALRTLRVEDQTTAVLVADAALGDRWMIVEMLLASLDAASIKGLDLVLDRFGTEGRNRLLRMLAALPDDESSVRRLFGHAAAPGVTAVAAIRAIAAAPAGLDERGRDLLRQQARSENALVRQEAITQLGRHQVPGSLPILRAALEDAAEPVRIAAALGLWRQADRSGAQALLDGLDDPELGAEVLGVFESAYAAPAPRDSGEWRRWLIDQGALPKDE